MAAARKGKGEQAARPAPSADAEEAFALSSATATLSMLCPGVKDAQAVACAVISRWIIERVKMAAASRLGMFDVVVFDLKDSKMRGNIEAALPFIAGQLAHIPADKPLFELSKEQVVDVFVAAIRMSAKAHIGGLELDDEIPF